MNAMMRLSREMIFFSSISSNIFAIIPSFANRVKRDFVQMRSSRENSIIEEIEREGQIPFATSVHERKS